MSSSKNKMNITKDKLVGEAKEAIGKVTNNEELELKGKIQSSKYDIFEKADDIKENIAGKLNDMIDKKKEKENSKK